MFHFDRLLVGAPNEMNGPYQTGDIYKCPLTKKNNGNGCSKLNLGTVSQHSHTNKHLYIVIIWKTLTNTTITFHISHHFKCHFIRMHLFCSVCVCHLVRVCVLCGRILVCVYMCLFAIVCLIVCLPFSSTSTLMHYGETTDLWAAHFTGVFQVSVHFYMCVLPHRTTPVHRHVCHTCAPHISRDAYCYVK